jgi:hypothetical protein
MVIAVGVLAVLALIGWLIYRGVKDKSIRAHTISYSLAIIAGIFTYAYFLSLDYPQLIKIVVSIFLGILLIILGALWQRHKAAGNGEKKV